MYANKCDNIELNFFFFCSCCVFCIAICYCISLLFVKNGLRNNLSCELLNMRKEFNLKPFYFFCSLCSHSHPNKSKLLKQFKNGNIFWFLCFVFSIFLTFLLTYLVAFFLEKRWNCENTNVYFGSWVRYVDKTFEYQPRFDREQKKNAIFCMNYACFLALWIGNLNFKCFTRK